MGKPGGCDRRPGNSGNSSALNRRCRCRSSRSRKRRAAWRTHTLLGHYRALRTVASAYPGLGSPFPRDAVARVGERHRRARPTRYTKPRGPTCIGCVQETARFQIRRARQRGDEPVRSYRFRAGYDRYLGLLQLPAATAAIAFYNGAPTRDR
jgi:hypothetical protein